MRQIVVNKLRLPDDWRRALAIGLSIVLLVQVTGYLVWRQERRVSSSLAKPSPVIVKNATVLGMNVAKPSPTASPAPVPLVGYCLRVPIIFYHHVEPMAQAKSEKHSSLTVDNTHFEQQMAYLVAKGYSTVSVDQVANALVSHQTVGSKTIAVTIDDGYQDIYSYAYPIAQKYHITLNLMIATGLINNPGFLNWDQLKEMVNSGLVFAYDHTWSHASLGNATQAKAQQEILTAKTQLENNLGKNVDIFSYPYGSGSKTVTSILRTNGFVAAVSTVPGFYQCDSFIYSLHRTRIGNAPLALYGL